MPLELTTHETYMNTIKNSKRRTIQQYRRNPKPPKEYIDLDISFYGFFSYQSQAWDHVLNSIRRYYPKEKIYLINDGYEQFDYKDMAEKYECIHVPKDVQICLNWFSIDFIYEFLHRTKEVCDKCDTEWVIHLHPDVICQDRISKHPHAALAGVSAGSKTGISNNIFPQKVINYVRKFQPNVKMNGWGWCGGSIVHVPTFKKVYDSVFVTKKISIPDMIKNIEYKYLRHEDVLMSLLFALNGFEYRIWLDNAEYQRGGDGIGDASAFLHGYKNHYNLKPGETVRQYFDRSIEENRDNFEKHKNKLKK